MTSKIEDERKGDSAGESDRKREQYDRFQAVGSNDGGNMLASDRGLGAHIDTIGRVSDGLSVTDNIGPMATHKSCVNALFHKTATNAPRWLLMKQPLQNQVLATGTAEAS